MEIYGRRLVKFELARDFFLALDFVVTDAVIPVVSTSQLQDDGIETHFTRASNYHSYNGLECPIHRCGRL